MILLLMFGCKNGKRLQTELKYYNAADVQLQNEAGIITCNHQPFTGTVYSLAAGKIDAVAVGSFVSGREGGEWRKYFAGGQLMEKRFYSTGKKVGVYEGWWPNGKRRLLYHFKEGEYEGVCKDWSVEGLLINEMNCYKGHEEGPQKQWYENGKIKANYLVNDGRRYGLLGTKNCVNVSDGVFRKS